MTRVQAPTIDDPIEVEYRVFASIEARPSRKVFLADGESYTMGRRVGPIGKGVGRRDIKY